ncbi:hypothetical protein J6590_030896 [Homalodisca vitripennis]|nr:hypothetical protein J6590_030896 [Homalodisca vitripennis]
MYCLWRAEAETGASKARTSDTWAGARARPGLKARPMRHGLGPEQGPSYETWAGARARPSKARPVRYGLGPEQGPACETWAGARARPSKARPVRHGLGPEQGPGLVRHGLEPKQGLGLVRHGLGPEQGPSYETWAGARARPGLARAGTCEAWAGARARAGTGETWAGARAWLGLVRHGPEPRAYNPSRLSHSTHLRLHPSQGQLCKKVTVQHTEHRQISTGTQSNAYILISFGDHIMGNAYLEVYVETSSGLDLVIQFTLDVRKQFSRKEDCITTEQESRSPADSKENSVIGKVLGQQANNFTMNVLSTLGKLVNWRVVDQ